MNETAKVGHLIEGAFASKAKGGPSGENNQDGAELFVVYDAAADICSPVFEQSSVGAARRVFRLKTLKEIPEGFDASDFSLWYVGRRRGVTLSSDIKLVAVGNEEIE